MKIADVVTQIRETLPNFTDLFGNSLSITSIVAGSGSATVTTTSAHGLTTGDAVTLVGVETRTPISSFSKVGFNFTFTTSADHDLTFDFVDNATIELDGFTDSAWNDTFELRGVDNRRSFQVQSTNADPVLNGSEFLLEPNRIDGLNGSYEVIVTGSNTFTISGEFLDGTYTPINGRVFSRPRVASIVDIDRALDEYTKQNLNDFWIFVEPKDVVVSKDRSTFSDANVTIANGNDIRVRMIDGFKVYIVAPTSDQIAGETALDICRNDLLLPMTKTLYGFKFPTGVTNVADFQTTLLGHRVAAYTRAFLVYEYEFEFVIDLTEDDRVRQYPTRAFRDIDYTQQVGGDDTTNATANIDLDDVLIIP